MSSGYTPKWKRVLIKIFPVLFKKCNEGNYHWRFDRLCFCQYNENGNKIVDMKTGRQYDFYDGWHPYENKIENQTYSAPQGEIKLLSEEKRIEKLLQDNDVPFDADEF